jgi:hypothetical protein
MGEDITFGRVAGFPLRVHWSVGAALHRMPVIVCSSSRRVALWASSRQAISPD